MTIKQRVEVMKPFYKNNANPTPTVIVCKLRTRGVLANDLPSVQKLI